MKCPYCNSDNTETYFKASMPNILSACPQDMLQYVKTFSLEIKLCKDCLLGFNATKLDDEELKIIYDNYLYISPMQGIGTSKYEGMLKTLKSFYSKDDTLVEIGCSEGYLLDRLKKEGYKNLIGVEPGPQAEQARKLGLKIIKEYFDENTFAEKQIDGFYLMHVFEHFENPFIILENMKKHLFPQGKIIIEVPDFRGYHHQHLYYYNEAFMSRLSKDKDLKIVSMDIQMEALRVVMVHKDNMNYKEKISLQTPEEITSKSYEQYQSSNERIKNINDIMKKNVGKEVYWWGAGSASIIQLNNIAKSIMDNVKLIVVDGDKNKWNCYVPGTKLKVNPYLIIKDKSIDCLIIASSFYKEIKETMNQNGIKANNIEVFYG